MRMRYTPQGGTLRAYGTTHRRKYRPAGKAKLYGYTAYRKATRYAHTVPGYAIPPWSEIKGPFRH